MIPHTIKEVQINKFIYIEAKAELGRGWQVKRAGGFLRLSINAVVALNA